MHEPKRSGDVPQHPQERNLRERSGADHERIDSENVPEPISFEEDPEAQRMIEDEDLSRSERDMPKADDMDDIKDA